MIFGLKDISFRYGEEWVLHDVTLSLPKGALIGLLGPNGSGKSTLLKLLSRLLEPQQGEITLEERPLKTLSLKELAKKIAVIEQDPWIEHPFCVEEVVLMGRYPYIRGLKFESTEDRQRLEEILHTFNLEPLRHRRLTEISAGERQRVFLAKALIQETPVLLLDEPVAHLDLRYQIEALKWIRALSERRGLTVFLVVHDLLLAGLFCDEIVLLKKGKVMAMGHPREALTPESVKAAFDIAAHLQVEPARRQVVLSLR